MTRPTERPDVHDRAPDPKTGVPVERHPRTGKLLPGDPGGRADKGRTPRGPKQVVALATGGALVAAAAVVVVLATRGGPDPAPAAAAPETSTSAAAPSTTTPPPPVDPGPRTVSVNLMTLSVTPPPGFPPDPTFGTVGEVRARTWTLTGPCDGAGTCTVEHCTAPGVCLPPLVGTPTGAGYVATTTVPVQWAVAGCSGGEIVDTVTFTISGDPLAPSISGEWVESTATPLLTGPGGEPCGIYLARFSIASA